MASPIRVDDHTHGAADVGPAQDMHHHPECPAPARPPAEPCDHPDQPDINSDSEFADDNGADTLSTHSVEAETVSSQKNESDATGPTSLAPSSGGYKGKGKGKETITISIQKNESHVTGPTSSAPSSRGGKGKGKETITVSSGNGSAAATIGTSSAPPKPLVTGSPSMDISPGGDGAGPASDQRGGGNIVSPTMNFDTIWQDIIDNAPANGKPVSFKTLKNLSLASEDVPDSVRKDIIRFEDDLDSAGMSSAPCSSVDGNLAPAIWAVAEDGSSLKCATMYQVGLNMLSSRQMREVLSLNDLREICRVCQECSSSFFAWMGLPKMPAEPQHNARLFTKDDVINCLFDMMGDAGKIKCCVFESGAAERTTTLRFGLNKEIVLYSLKSGEPITFVCCDETFPSKDWADEAVKAFERGALPWDRAGLTFKRVGRTQPAHFRIAFSLMPKDLDGGTLAQAFFPSAANPEQRTLWVYLLAFHPLYRGHMAGVMGHEAGHIGGSRHGHDEHFRSDGSEKSGLKSVKMGHDNPMSGMNYFDNLADLAIQGSDIDDMRNMYSYDKDVYKGYPVRKVAPAETAYPLMLSFE
ncbi:hypothetical protein F4802DRAFT_553399 [Xylaria palmicola]|nr:hypothetical protein F4802DRAFT_553399 [Xylaria palmicola]